MWYSLRDWNVWHIHALWISYMCINAGIFFYYYSKDWLNLYNYICLHMSRLRLHTKEQANRKCSQGEFVYMDAVRRHVVTVDSDIEAMFFCSISSRLGAVACEWWSLIDVTHIFILVLMPFMHPGLYYCYHNISISVISYTYLLYV